MILFGASLSPFVRKTMAYITEKGLDVEFRATGTASSDPEFLACSPFRKIPAFSDGDFKISDSTAIITYLEARHPAPALIPIDARARARTIWYEEFADTILTPCMGKLFFNRVVAPRFLKREGDLAAASKAEKEELPPILAYLEGVVPASGFLVDDRLTLADLAVASPFVNLAHLGIVPDARSHPRLAAYISALHGRPSYAPIIAKETAQLART